MRTVGIKQLKARLSEYVRAAKLGEVFLVTDRDAVVAELRPPGPASGSMQGPKSVGQVLADLAAAGEVTLPTATFSGWIWNPNLPRLAPGTAQAILDELRADREFFGE